MSTAKKVLILGGAAHQNRGDLAMQAGLVQWVQREAPDSEIVFFSSAPAPTEVAMGIPCQLAADAELATVWNRETATNTKQRKRAIRRGRRFVRNARLYRKFGWCPASKVARKFFRVLSEARCALVPGSGSMNSLWWHDWLYPKAFTVLAARAMGVPIAMTSQGVGREFSHPLDAQVAKDMFSACEFIGVRDDQTSGDILQGIGVDIAKVRHTGDDALLFESSAPLPLPPSRAPGSAIHIGVNLRDASSYQKGYAKANPERIAGILDSLASRHPLRLVFIPISYDAQDDDRESARAVIDAMQRPEATTIITGEYDAAGIRSLCGQMDAAIGISYHFLLFSLSANVPALLLYSNPYYAHKAKGLARLYDAGEQALDLNCLDDKQIEAAIDVLIRDAKPRRRTLEAVNTDLEHRAEAARNEIAAHLLHDAI